MAFLMQILFFNLYRIFTGRSSLGKLFRGRVIFVTGVPRTGSTFMTRIVRQIFCDYSIVSQHHNTIYLRYAVEVARVPVLVCVRDPLDACMSHWLKDGFEDYHDPRAKKTFVEYLRRNVRYLVKLKSLRDGRLVVFDFNRIQDNYYLISRLSMLSNPQEKLSKCYINWERLAFAVQGASNTLERDPRALAASGPNREKSHAREKLIAQVESDRQIKSIVSKAEVIYQDILKGT